VSARAIFPFHLQRDEDVTGISGTGIVAYGVVLPTGRVILEWTGEIRSLTVHASMTDVEKIHCHNGATKVVWDG